jgi:alpha-beta hydrolase superfamily lysophospholipase
MHTQEWVHPQGQLYCCKWTQDTARISDSRHPHTQQPVGVLILVHGMGESMVRYEHVAEEFVGRGYIVYGFDNYGHGRTPGKRGHVKHYEQLFEGIDVALARAQQEYPHVPIFLYGHSMGGNVTLNYLLRRNSTFPAELQGAIVTSPWLKLAFNPSTLLLFAGLIMDRLFPSFSTTRPTVAGGLTSDPVIIARYKHDKLGHMQITARFYYSVNRAGMWALTHASQLTLPILLMQGTDDQVTSLPATQEFAQTAPPELITLRIWPKFKHELQNEIGRQEVFTTEAAWLTDQLAK